MHEVRRDISGATMNRWIKQEHDQLKEFQIRGRVAGDLFPHLAKHFGELAELMKDKLSLLETMQEVRKRSDQAIQRIPPRSHQSSVESFRLS
jgi:hypothetical protein